MKQLHTRCIQILAAILCTTISFGQSGIYESYVVIDTGAGDIYYDLQANTGNPDFNGRDLGTFTLTETLFLTDGQNKIFKCENDDVTDGKLYYRIFLQGDTPGSFSSFQLNNVIFEEDNPFCFNGSDKNQTWENDPIPNPSIDLSSGLNGGDYFLEVYTTADFTYSTGSGTHVDDNGGNFYRAAFRVDNPPEVVCHDTITVALDAAGQAAITVDDIDDGSSDDLDASPLLSIDITSFDCNDIGTPVTVTLTVTDSLGQSDSCETTVTVEDNIDPEIPTLLPLNGECSATATAPTTTDTCAGTITGTTTDPLTYSTQGEHTINWTFDDGNGNSIVVPQTVIVDDTTNPVAPTLATLNGECSVTATAPTTTDTCAGTITGTTTDPLTYSTQGEHTINWTFDDGNGNSIVVPQTIIVDDTTPPVIPSLATITGECSATATAPTTTDTCAGTITGTTTDPLTYSTQGEHTINWTFDDGNGNSIVVPQTVTVDDITPPVIPSLATLNGECSATATAPTTTDTCSGTITGTTTDPLFYDTQGEHTINWTFDDGNGNSIVVPQTVIVDDTTNPVAPTLATITGECSATATAPTTTDTCAGTITGTTTDPLFYDTQGEHTINWTFDDGNGNSIVVPQTIIVDDTTPPVIPTLATITDECSVTATAPTTTDTCAGTITGTTTDPLTYSTQGEHTINWTFDDGNGNSIVVPQTIIVDDTTPPVIPSLATITGECSATATAPTTTDTCAGTITGTTTDPLTYSTQGEHTINWTFDDGNGNSIVVPQTIIVDDTTPPVILTLATITGECSATATAPTTTDTCSGTITGTTTDPLFYDTQGAHTITWTFDDGNGNSINANQTVFINDDTPPTPMCQDLTVFLDDTTGTVTITPDQVDNGSTDNCNLNPLTFTLSKSSFDCTNIGPNIVTLTVTDSRNNSSACQTTITVISPNISGGNIDGYLTNTELPADATLDEIIEVTACPDEPQNALLTLNGHSGTIAHWESSINGGITWNTIANTTDTYAYNDIQNTTILRAVITIGACQAYSNLFYIVVVPPDVPPTIIGESDFTMCLGGNITVVAESSYGIIPDFNEGGLFNEANPEGWDVDGTGHMPAAANNTNDTSWRETNGPKKFGGRCYNNVDGKFAIASGIGEGDFTPLTYLETPIFNTLGLTTASLEFEQAYYLNAGAWCRIELSTDGGATYPITLDPGASYDYTGPSDTGYQTGNFNGQCSGAISTTMVDKPVMIDLQNYIGLVGLRIRFTFNGNAGSAWAIDNVRIPESPVDEVIEWTDENGVVVTTGSSTVITPTTPGIQTFGVTSLINGCRSAGDEGTEFITVRASLAYAGEAIVPTAGECGITTVQLAAYDNTLSAIENYNNGVWNNDYILPDIGAGDIDYPGTGQQGFWEVSSSPSSCGGTYSFSDNNSPHSTFTGSAGTYTLTWTVAGCSSNVTVTLENCSTVDFDGEDDYVTFGDSYDRGSAFSIEVWAKPESVNGDQTLLSKRNGPNGNSGYDLRLQGSTLSFNWNTSGSLVSPYPLTTQRWYHIAITYDGETYRMYLDGILVNSTGGSAPAANAMDFLLGAMHQSTNPPNTAIRHFNGWLDEVRIWNKTITVAQIRQMMNQRITNNGAVRGETVPLDIAGLQWSHLDGYYRMDVGCGALVPYAGSVAGTLRNINTSQENTAPLPYTSRVDGQQWAVDNTWTHYAVWDAPNSLGIDGSTPIDWNIVRTSHNIASGNKDITVLGLISDAADKTLTIADPSTLDENNDGQGLRVTHYLKLDGTIDLVGESQLVQDEGSILDEASIGKLERDQQGTTNYWNYNYWSAPVTLQGAPNNGPYTVDGVLRDGTISSNPLPLQWTSSYDANGSTTPITLSRRWIYGFHNFPLNSYSDWDYLTEMGSLDVGLGFTMKGSGAADSNVQNYVFVGKPNNGTITNTISIGNEALIGNPYPSAIDATEFILDNIVGGNPGTTASIDGTIYYWEHYTSNATHILEDYEGGYSAYNLTGTTTTVIPEGISGAGTSTKTPGRYIPIGQAFFVRASSSGGTIEFQNDQRVFKREAVGSSVFFRQPNPNVSAEASDSQEDIQRLHLEFLSDDGLIRPLLLGFTPDNAATDGYDPGYDGLMTDEFPNDMSWDIDGEHYIIQGVGAFDVMKSYPLHINVSHAGIVDITLAQLENFETPIDVFVYDSLSNLYTQINSTAYSIYLESGVYQNRFYITFTSDTALSVTNPEHTSTIQVNYLLDSNELYINSHNGMAIENVYLINLLGQIVHTWNKKDFHSVGSETRIPVRNISEGNYIVKVQTDSGSINKKIIIKY